MPDWAQHVRQNLRLRHLEPEREAEIVEDLAGQLDEAYREALERGLTEEQAAAAAIEHVADWTSLSNELAHSQRGKESAMTVLQHKIEDRDASTRGRFRLLTDLRQDIGYGLRMLRKSPGFTAVAVLTLALGIGANTALFSVVDAVLLKPLPYKDSNRLVVMWEHGGREQSAHNVVAPRNFLDWQDQNRVFQNMAYLSDSRSNLTGGARPEQIDEQDVSSNFFDVLGVKPALGHWFTAANGVRGNDDVVVLSYALWRDQFGSDTAVVGKSIELNGTKCTILGVAPPGFDSFIAAGSFTAAHPQLWTPFVFPARFYGRTQIGRFLTVIARLKDDVTVSQAQAQMNVLASGLSQKFPQYDANWGVTLTPIREEISGSVRPALLILFGAVGFVLLIACANVASLQLSRAASRKKEIAVRTALGASRWRIARQLLSESMLLAAIGGGLGLFVAVWGTDLLLEARPANLSTLSSVALDPRVLIFAAVVTFLAACIFGFLPSYATAHSQIASALQEGGRSSSGGPRSQAMRSVLAAGEIALALMLLTGSGLLVQSFIRLMRVDPGFGVTRLLTFKLYLPTSVYKDDAARITFFSALFDKLRQIPGVRSVSDENLPPFTGFSDWGVATDVRLPGQEAAPEPELPVAAVRVVGSDYFRTMEIPLVQGRAFQPSEFTEAKHTVIINEAFAQAYFSRKNPIGQKITIYMKEKNVPSEIVGVAGNVHGADLRAKPWPTVYWPYPELAAYSAMTVLVRTATPPLSIVPAVRQAVKAIDKNEPIADLASMDQLVAKSVSGSRFTMFLLAIFAVLALILALIGIYGVMSYSVAQRTNEIGIRIALGAQQGDVLALVLGQGMRLALTGVVIGVAAALALTRLLATLLFSVSATDPVTFAAVAVLLTIVALIACYLPARRAMRVDPLVALRHE